MKEEFSTLIKSIKGLAQSERNTILNDSKKKAKQIIAQVEEELIIFEQKAKKDLEKEIQSEKQKLNSKILLEKKRILSKLREKLMKKLFQEVKKQIDDVLKTDAYKTIFKNLLLSAVNEISADAILIISETDSLIASDIIKKNNLNISMQTENLPLGTIILNSKSGFLTVDNSINTRLDKTKELFRSNIINILLSKKQ